MEQQYVVVIHVFEHIVHLVVLISVRSHCYNYLDSQYEYLEYMDLQIHPKENHNHKV